MVRPALLLPLAAALALAPGAAPAAPRGRELILCSDPWMPYTGDGRPGSDEGYVVALTRAALARAGHRVRYVTAPWSRCIANVQAGRWDAIACVDAREVEDVVYPAEPVGETRPAFFTRRGATWTYRGLASLEEIRLGAIQGYAYDDAIDPWFRAHAGDARRLFLATGTDPLRRLFEMLEAGRIDAILESPLVAAWTAHQPGSPLTGPLRPAGDVGTLVPIYVAFSRRIRDGSALAADLDAGLRALRAEGKLAPLLQRYHVPPWPAAEARRP